MDPFDNERSSAARKTRVAAVIATAVLAVCAAGCGTTTTRTNMASAAQAVAYARCLRSNGVPNWPDPNSSGVFDKSKLQDLGVSSSRLQSAQHACAHLAPNGGRPPSQAQVQEMRAQAVQFSQCVRAHGVPTFPDPDSTGRIPDPASVGIDQGAPKFQAANRACGRYRPPYMPSNAAYNAYARTHGG